jgi:transposase-like protein
MDFMNFFSTEQKCHEFLKSILWKDGKHCPHCGSNEIMEYKSNFKKNRCKSCKMDFSMRKGTIFEESRMSLQKWFMCIYLMNSNKKGISSLSLSRQVGINKTTAWFVLQRLRYVGKNFFLQTEFEGVTEIDEAYIGGSETNKHAHKKGKSEKTVVIGMVNRNTKTVKAVKIPTAEKDFLLPKINLNVKQGSTIITDTYGAYKDLNKRFYHETVKHSEGEYVKVSARVAFKIHTNTVEGFWSLLKRGINGTYHWVSKKHMNRYLNEFSLRYNTRELADNQRFASFLGKVQGRITYKELIA